MKLNGNSRGSHSAPRHEKPSRARGEDFAPGRDEAAAAGENLTYEPAAEGGYEPAPAKRRGSGAKRAAAILGAIAAVIALCVIGYALWEKPPEFGGGGLVQPVTPSAAPAESADPNATPLPDPHRGTPTPARPRAITTICTPSSSSASTRSPITPTPSCWARSTQRSTR